LGTRTAIVPIGPSTSRAQFAPIQSVALGVLPASHGVVIVLLDSCEDTNDYVVGQRKIDFNRAIARGTRLVLVHEPSISNAVRPPSEFFLWLTHELGIEITPRGQREIRSAAPELEDYFADQLTYAVIEEWHGRDDPRGDAQVLATTASGELEVASRWLHNGAEVIMLPHRNPQSPDALSSILAAVERIRPAEFPPYLDQLILFNEDDLRDELATLELRRTEIETDLESLRRLKAILHLTGFDLEHEVVRFLNDELGIRARHVTGNREDFLLTNDAGDAWAARRGESG